MKKKKDDRQRVRIEMLLPPGENILNEDDLLNWILNSKLSADSQGIEFRVFINDEELEMKLLADLDENYKGKPN